MSLESIVLSEAVKYGAVVIGLIVAVAYFVGEVRALRKEGREREEAWRKEAKEREDKALAREQEIQAACVQREAGLADRLRQLEDRQVGQLQDSLRDSARINELAGEALLAHARALEVWSQESGRHRTVDTPSRPRGG